MRDFLDQHDFILAEAAVVERLRRKQGIQLDADLVHAPLIYSENGRAALGQLYTEYLGIAEASDCPIMLCTPTWRANKERVTNSNSPETINADAARFLQGVVASAERKVPVKIGGLIGCKNDCYLPEEAPSTEEARVFHHWQIGELASSGVDFLIAVTLPSVDEAAGIALAMEATSLPYIISFVIGADGKVLDGTELQAAIEFVDSKVQAKPLGYFINCSYPTFIQTDGLSKEGSQRFIGIQANASSLTHAELEGSNEVQSENVSEWGDSMMRLNKELGVKILGGCCGTDEKHLEYLLKLSAEHRR